MTLFALLADIHANLAALDAVLEDMAARGIERLLVAGDMVTGGPQPHETLRRLVDQGAKMIRGNNEEYMLRFTKEGRASTVASTIAISGTMQNRIRRAKCPATTSQHSDNHKHDQN